MQIKDLSLAKVKDIRLYATAGSEIGGCLREAAILALSENCSVILTHNCSHFHVCPKTLVEAIELMPDKN